MDVQVDSYTYSLTGRAQVVLNCSVHKDLQYTRANPTFHHWRTEGKRFGLTFQSSTEARLFEKAIRKAVEGIREGISITIVHYVQMFTPSWPSLDTGNER
jgi:anthranilate/para-aminobenzoate synthase component I